MGTVPSHTSGRDLIGSMSVLLHRLWPNSLLFVSLGPTAGLLPIACSALLNDGGQLDHHRQIKRNVSCPIEWMMKGTPAIGSLPSVQKGDTYSNPLQSGMQQNG